MEEHLLSVLEAGLPFRCTWGPLPEKTGLPRAVVFKTSGTQALSSDGPGLITARVQIDAYGETYGQANTAGELIRGILSGYRGDVVQGVFLEVLRDGVEGDRTLLHRVSMTFSVTYRETLPD